MLKLLHINYRQSGTSRVMRPFSKVSNKRMRTEHTHSDRPIVNNRHASFASSSGISSSPLVSSLASPPSSSSSLPLAFQHLSNALSAFSNVYDSTGITKQASSARKQDDQNHNTHNRHTNDHHQHPYSSQRHQRYYQDHVPHHSAQHHHRHHQTHAHSSVSPQSFRSPHLKSPSLSIKLLSGPVPTVGIPHSSPLSLAPQHHQQHQQNIKILGGPVPAVGIPHSSPLSLPPQHHQHGRALPFMHQPQQRQYQQHLEHQQQQHHRFSPSQTHPHKRARPSPLGFAHAHTRAPSHSQSHSTGRDFKKKKKKKKKPVSLHDPRLNGVLAVEKGKGMTSAGVVDIIKAIVNPSSERALQDAEDRKTKDSLKLRWSNGPASSARENNSTGDTAGNNASNQNVEPRQNNRKGGKRRGRMDPNRVKVGHGGTLDPDATGVLVIGLGDGCKSMKEYLAGDKVYLAEGTLGYATDTYDESGQRTAEAPCDHVTESDFSNALSAFIGDIEQVPPMYSALKVKGKKLYELAFEGKTVERKARPVTCYDIELIEFDQPNFTIRVRCGGGFYIRSLIYDIGRKLDTYAVMTDLRRTKQGQFELDSYLTLMQPQEKWGLELIMQKLAQSNEKLAQKQVEREAGKKKEDRKGGEGE